MNEEKKQAFHPTDQPHGSRNYDLDALEPEQLKKLQDKKLFFRQENEVYLKNHPEIRGLITILLRYDFYKYLFYSITYLFKKYSTSFLNSLFNFFNSIL